MSDVTDADRAKARQVVDSCSPEAAYVDEFIYDGEVAPLHEAIAKALAEERRKAREPFLVIAEACERAVELVGIDEERAIGLTIAAARIRSALKETE